MQHRNNSQDEPGLPTNNPTDSILNREHEVNALHDRLTLTGQTSLYLYGPRGSGKTAVTQQVVDQLPNNIETSYISCLSNNTQYQVLDEVYYTLTGTRLGTGYHTSDLKHRIEGHLDKTETVLILDEIDFLLTNDGDGLLYYLSRLEPDQPLKIIGISANYPEPQTVIDSRTYSSLHPEHIEFRPYTQEHTETILSHLASGAIEARDITQDALTYIASTTQNIRFGLHWLDLAINTAEEYVSTEVVKITHLEAIQRYQNTLLKDFTTHHYILLEAIKQLVSERDGTTYTGAVYDRYEELCDDAEESNLSHRQLSDYITHLNLLHIIDVNHEKGGTQGKTREIQLNSTF